MVVNLTPNLGLKKPTEDELAGNWDGLIVGISDANNNILENATNALISLPYVPTIISTAAPNPSVGAGTILGEYINFQGFIMGTFSLVFTNPGILVGTGAGGYGIKLPTLVDNAFHSVATALNAAPGPYTCIGEGYFADASALATSGSIALDVVRIAGVDYARGITETYATKGVVNNEWLGLNSPVPVADGDILTGSFFYKAA